uniref:Cysteine and tyrosine-rich protein 1 n=1 Tax=Anthurium amnicola TaxID=1678845 RepID=A0A1D1XCQ3_9ARAE
MTLKRYNIIVYFIILLNLVINVIIAQKVQTTLLPSTTTSSLKPSQTLIPGENSGENSGEHSASAVEESCLKGACSAANDTIKRCNGIIKTPNEYIEENIRSGTYEPDDRFLARCMCNQPYYDLLSTCIGCFNNATKTGFKVAPLDKYEEECKNLGTTFTETMPDKIPSSIPPKLILGVVGGVIIVVLIVVGIIIFKYYKRRNAKDKVSVEGAGNLSTSNSNKYPPPASYNQHSQYTPPPSDSPYYPPPPGQGDQYPPPQSYPPPQGGYPPPQQRGGQSGQDIQYPPPSSQQHGDQGDRTGQGGQSDSYYDGNF